MKKQTETSAPLGADEQAGSPSILEVRDGCFGQPLPMILRRTLPKAVHTVTVDCAGRHTVLMSESRSYPLLVWEPSLEEYAPLLPDSAEAEAVFTVETYCQGRHLGTESRTVTMRIPAGALAPAFSEGWVTLRADNGPDAAVDCYAAGISCAEAAFDPEKIDVGGLLGASIAGFELEALGERVTEPPYRSAVLWGETRLRCSVVDSRGQRHSRDFTVTPLNYAPPKLTEISVNREGTELTAQAKAVFSTLEGQNACTLSAALRPVGGEFGPETALVFGEEMRISGLESGKSYELRILARDRLGQTDQILRLLPGEGWAMKFRPAGRGVAFGKAAERDRALELPADWEIRIGQESLFLRLHPVGSAVLADTAPAEGRWENLGAMAGTYAWRRKE